MGGKERECVLGRSKEIASPVDLREDLKYFQISQFMLIHCGALECKTTLSNQKVSVYYLVGYPDPRIYLHFYAIR